MILPAHFPHSSVFIYPLLYCQFAYVPATGFPGGSVGKESGCNAGDPGSIPGLVRFPMVKHSSILAWRIPWTEEPGGLYSIGLQELDTT